MAMVRVCISRMTPCHLPVEVMHPNEALYSRYNRCSRNYNTDFCSDVASLTSDANTGNTIWVCSAPLLQHQAL